MDNSPVSCLQQQPANPQQSPSTLSSRFPTRGPATAVGSSAQFLRAVPITIDIIIDALDECNDKDLMGEFIEILIDAFMVNRGLPIRILITSRVEEHI